MSTCAKVSVNDEQHYLYSFLPKCAINARDPENSSGMFVDEAWARHTIGDPSVVVAYVEGGINWHADSAKDLVDQVYLNKGELPLPEDANGSTHPDACLGGYDLDCDGVFSVKEYAHDPRVQDSNGNGYVDPEDLIVAFSCWDAANRSLGVASWPGGKLSCTNGAESVDNDGNGFPHDISGWDFYDHQNDPATVDSTYGHANGQMERAAAEANNGIGGAGVCPGCRILPIKAGAEALDRTDDLAQAWNYADTVGASVVVSVTADLGYSTAMAQTVDRLWRDGVVMVEASNDFDSTDHQGGMWWPHVLPGNGLVADTQNAAQSSPLDNPSTLTFRERSGYTSWGTHNVFSVATQGGTTSESTPIVGGVMALVLSEGRKLSPPLSGPEAVQVVRATASVVDDPLLAWPGAPGWSLQYGYGRPNVEKAMEAIDAGAVPPVASLDAPGWYALDDPTTQPLVPVEGKLAARTPGPVHWTLEWAAGAQPGDDDWMLAANGTAFVPASLHDAATIDFGALDLAKLPASFWDDALRMSHSKTLESSERFAVTIRLRVADASGLVGEERRAITVHHDPTLLWGGAKAIGSSGESQPAIVQMQGATAVVFGDADGRIHALDGRTGQELPGWPAFTDPVVPDEPEPGIDFGHEPIVAPVAVGDFGSGFGERVVATSTSGHVYVLDDHGARVRRLDATLAAVAPAVPRPAMPFTRLPHAGATASPVLYDLQGSGSLDVIQASWDGRVYVWDRDGNALPGWPVTVAFTGTPQPGHAVVNDHKIDVTPAVADLEGNGKSDLVVVSQMTEVVGSGLNPLGILHVFAFHPDGSPVAGWPATLPSVVEYYGSAQEFLTEGSTAPAVADVDHDGRDEVAVSPVLSPSFLLGGDGSVRAVFGPAPDPAESALELTPHLDAAFGDPVTDAPVTFTTSGAFATVGGTLSYLQGGSGGASVADALLLPGSGSAIHNEERAYDALTGAPRPGFPATMQGLDFLGAPIVADVDGLGLPDVIDGADSSAMHAWTPAGTLAAGFPKLTTGWTLFSPSAGDLLGDGHTDVVTVTREGYVMAWSTPGVAGVGDWPTYHHDVWRTGNVATRVGPGGAQALARAPTPGGLALLPGLGVAAGVASRRRR